MSELPHTVSAHVRIIEKERITLEIVDGQTLLWPTHLLPESIKIGDQSERERLAKYVLNEMLKGS